MEKNCPFSFQIQSEDHREKLILQCQELIILSIDIIAINEKNLRMELVEEERGWLRWKQALLEYIENKEIEEVK